MGAKAHTVVTGKSAPVVNGKKKLQRALSDKVDDTKYNYRLRRNDQFVEWFQGLGKEGRSYDAQIHAGANGTKRVLRRTNSCPSFSVYFQFQASEHRRRMRRMVRTQELKMIDQVKQQSVRQMIDTEVRQELGLNEPSSSSSDRPRNFEDGYDGNRNEDKEGFGKKGGKEEASGQAIDAASALEAQKLMDEAAFKAKQKITAQLEELEKNEKAHEKEKQHHQQTFPRHKSTLHAQIIGNEVSYICAWRVFLCRGKVC